MRLHTFVSWLSLVILLAVLGGVLLKASPTRLVVSNSRQANQENPRRLLMQEKLEHSKELLGGLAEARFDTIVRASKALDKLREDSSWYNLPTDEYQVHSQTFRAVIGDLTKAAEKEDIDAATLAFVRLTVNCVECHKYVRVQTKAASPSRQSNPPR